MLHVAGYGGPNGFTGAHVLVVGLGDSGRDVALAAAEVGASVTVSVRGGVYFVDYPNALGQHAGALWRRLRPRLADVLVQRVRRDRVVRRLPLPHHGELASALAARGAPRRADHRG